MEIIDKEDKTIDHDLLERSEMIATAIMSHLADREDENGVPMLVTPAIIPALSAILGWVLHKCPLPEDDKDMEVMVIGGMVRSCLEQSRLLPKGDASLVMPVCTLSGEEADRSKLH